MKQNLSILALLLMALVAVVSGQNPVPPGTSAQATPTKPDAAAEIKVAGAPYHAAVEAVSAEYQKWVTSLETWYLAELDKLQAARAKLGDLDGAIATKKERERMASHSPATPEQIQAMPAPLRTLRAGYDQGLKRSADEGARRIDVARRKYLTDLEALQKRITVAGDIDQALLVKAEKDRFIAEMAGDAQGVAAVRPSKVPVEPVTTADASAKPAGTSAKVEADDTTLAPLEVGAGQQDRKLQFADIPKGYEGFQFTLPKNGATLRFKVLSDGLVQLACTSRFARSGNSSGGWKNEILTEPELEQKGWHRLRDVELKNNGGGYTWLVFARTCKTGEQFTIRTEKYASPFLLVK